VIGIENGADKTKYMVMSRDQNAGPSYNVKIVNNFFENVERLKYWGTTLTSKNSIRKDVKSRLTPNSACYHSVQNPQLVSTLSMIQAPPILLPSRLHDADSDFTFTASNDSPKAKNVAYDVLSS
jgi:hypothetical protein